MKSLQYLLLSLMCFAFSSFKFSQDSSVKYIQKYKELALLEKERTGIPASIKIAQGLLESQNGTSDLAIQANNHFGIKCKRSWKGQTYYHMDDDTDSSGRLMESCFRAYNSPIDSYVDHSNFLMWTDHYRLLFEFDPGDYKNWARGLKYFGYATDPNYDNKLIKIIEEFELDQLDIIHSEK